MTAPQEVGGSEKSGMQRPDGLAYRNNRLSRTAVPSFFTLMNLFSGFLAVTQIHEGQYAYACYLIVLAGFFDLLDGMMARLSQGQSHFGVELDSLSDIVSFGVAPSYLIYAIALEDFGVFGVLASGLPAMCAAVRLARYNVTYEGEAKDYFNGLPAPVQAYAFVLVALNGDAHSWLLDGATLFPVVFVLSALMVTNIAFDGTPKPTTAYLAAKPLVVTGYVIGVALIVVLRETGLLVGLAAYILTGVLRAVYRGVHAVMKRNVNSTKLSGPH